MILIPAGGRAAGAKLEMAPREVGTRAAILDKLLSGAIRGRFGSGRGAVECNVNGELPYSDPDASASHSLAIRFEEGMEGVAKQGWAWCIVLILRR